MEKCALALHPNVAKPVIMIKLLRPNVVHRYPPKDTFEEINPFKVKEGESLMLMERKASKLMEQRRIQCRDPRTKIGSKGTTMPMTRIVVPNHNTSSRRGILTSLNQIARRSLTRQKMTNRRTLLTVQDKRKRKKRVWPLTANLRGQVRSSSSTRDLLSRLFSRNMKHTCGSCRNNGKRVEEKIVFRATTPRSKSKGFFGSKVRGGKRKSKYSTQQKISD